MEEMNNMPELFGMLFAEAIKIFLTLSVLCIVYNIFSDKGEKK